MDINKEKNFQQSFFKTSDKLLFGVDSRTPSNTVLTNKQTMFEMISKEKIYPNFWGRNLTGTNCLSKEEIAFLHSKGCKIAAIHTSLGALKSEEQGKIHAKKITVVAASIGIPENAAIFLEISESGTVTRDYLKGYAQNLISDGYTPGFKINTGKNGVFNGEYIRGLESDKVLFSKCLIWDVSPDLKTSKNDIASQLICSYDWFKYMSSDMTEREITIRQFAKEAFTVSGVTGVISRFNMNLVRDEQVIIDKMF